jgi:hypothetical protein
MSSYDPHDFLAERSLTRTRQRVGELERRGRVPALPRRSRWSAM